MVGRRMGKIAVLIFLWLYLIPYRVLAAHTAEAKEPIIITEDCSLTITYSYDKVSFSDQNVKLYKVADASAEASYTVTDLFASSKIQLNGLRSSEEWNTARTTLENHVIANKTEPIKTETTDSMGQVNFTELNPGIYLISAVRVPYKNSSCTFDSALIALPGLDETGTWQYQASINTKPEILPEPLPDDDIQYKVLKLWKDDKTIRPGNVEIEIFRGETIVDNVILSEENNWSYSWTTKDDGARWTVVERNVPEGYTMTMKERGTTFVVTNSQNSSKQDDGSTDHPSDVKGTFDIIPKTGDNANITLAMLILLISGSVLIISEFRGRKHE